MKIIERYKLLEDPWLEPELKLAEAAKYQGRDRSGNAVPHDKSKRENRAKAKAARKARKK